MGGDDPTRDSTTRRFTPEELAELARRSRGEEPEPPAAPREAPAGGPAIPTPMSRSQTLHDPLTTEVLAEVARRLAASETDGDGEGPADDAEPDGSAHPHTRRRR